MGFFADIVADSRYTIRRSGSRFPAHGLKASEPYMSEQSQHPNQSQQGAGLDLSIEQNAGLEASPAGRAEVTAPSQALRPSHHSEAASAQNNDPQSVQTAAPPTPAVKVAGAMPLIQRMPTSPHPAGMPAQSAVIRATEKHRSESAALSGTPQGVVSSSVPKNTGAGKEPVKAESVSRVNVPTPSTMGRTVTEPFHPFKSVFTPPGGIDDHAVQREVGAVSDNAAASAGDGLSFNQPPVAEEGPSSAVLAGAVKQVSSSVQHTGPMTAQPAHAGSTSKLAAPQVRIGQVNVIIEGPKKLQGSPTQASTGDDLASRIFLRSL